MDTLDTVDTLETWDTLATLDASVHSLTMSAIATWKFLDSQR